MAEQVFTIHRDGPDILHLNLSKDDAGQLVSDLMLLYLAMQEGDTVTMNIEGHLLLPPTDFT